MEHPKIHSIVLKMKQKHKNPNGLPVCFAGLAK